jgi:hypothetical protein
LNDDYEDEPQAAEEVPLVKILKYDTEDLEFARGVEVGRMFELLKEAPFLNMVIHTQNAEMAMRLAEHFEMDFAAVPTPEDDELVRVLMVSRDEEG